MGGVHATVRGQVERLSAGSAKGSDGPNESVYSACSSPNVQLKPVGPQPPPPPLASDVVRYSLDVLTTERGLVRGVWAKFEPVEWLEDIPALHGAGVDGPGILRRLLICVLGLSKVARDRADLVDFTPRELGEGSFATVWQLEEWPHVVVKVLDKPAREVFKVAAARNACEAWRRGLGPRVYGTGWLRQEKGAQRRFMVIVLEALLPLDLTTSESACPVLTVAREISQWAFHNDLTLVNVMSRQSCTGGPREPVVIDYDMADEWRLKLAVTTSFIEFDFRPLFESRPPALSSSLLPLWREYCDLVLLTCSVDGSHILYRPTLARLVDLFEELREQVLEPLFTTDLFTSNESKTLVPFEVCVRAPGIEAVTINLGDLTGNAFAHGVGTWAQYPSVIRSNGVYWPE